MAQRGAGEQVAGRYVIEREIGRGGMGAVYSARDVRLGRRVALKTIGDTFDLHVIERLEIEARAVASIDHPGIVTLYDVVEDRGETVLVMELVGGETLRTILKTRTLAPDEVARIVYEVSDALDAAHQKKLVHRDVKPDNVMIRSDGRIALLDFGIAKQTSDAIDAAEVTTTGAGVILGTPAYLAPEQAHALPLGPAADQFALAVTAYELLTGKLPWPTTTPMLLVAAIVSSPPRPLEGFQPAVSEALERALEKSPAARYPTVVDFANAFGGALGVARPSRPRSLLPESSGPAPAAMPSEPRAPSTLEIDKTLRATERRLASHPPRGKRRALAFIAFLALGGTAIAIFAARSRRPLPVAGDASDVALPIADIGADDTASAAARGAVKGAMSALSIGRGDAAVIDWLDAAMKADPECASAALQRAYASFRISGALDASGRRAYRVALEHRGKLSARNADFLDALAPSFADPPDWTESGKRFVALLARRPRDAEAWEALGILRFKQSRLEDAEDAFAREHDVDPNAYTSYFLRGFLRANRGDLAGAKKSFAECIERIPATIECRRAVVAMERSAGECAAADAVAREAATLAPEDPQVWAMRAETAASLGAGRGALVDLLEQKRSRMPADAAKRAKAKDDYALAMRDGDFDAALAALDEADRVDQSDRIDDAASRAVERARLLREMGEPVRAADVAVVFLERMIARTLPEQAWQDPTGALLAIAHAGGRITDADWATRRDAWVAGWRTRLGPEGWRQDGLAVWIGALASLDDPSPARASDALRALPDFGDGNLARYDPSIQENEARVGALFVAAGRIDDAIPRLESATRWCRLAPLVRGFLSLGEARAAKGDVTGACDAFATVERQWAGAKPRSVTLEAARAESKRHACAK
ncbi:MAG TPA: serine/threonine-protein kinase [Polyangiaceae bacterium]|jgi:serine/threonine-protein kinase